MSEFGESPGYGQQYFPGQVSFGQQPRDTTKNPLEEFEWYRTFKELLNAYLADIEGQDADDMDRVDRMNAANAWIDAMQTGNMDVIKNVDVSALEDMPGWSEYYSGIVGTPEETQSAEQSLIDKYGKAVVDDFKQKYEDIVATVGKAADDPWAAIEGLISTASNTKGPCWEGAYGGKEWVRNCVTVGVLVGIPGLPVPPIPGIVGATVGEIEDAVKTVGKTIEDFIEKPVDTIKEVAGDVWEGIQGIFEKGSDPKGIYDYVNGIFGSVMSGVIMNEIGDAIDKLFVGEDEEEEEETAEVPFDPEEFDPDREVIVDPSDTDLDGIEDEEDEEEKEEVLFDPEAFDPDREVIVDPSDTDSEDTGGFELPTKEECLAKGRVFAGGYCLEECSQRDSDGNPFVIGPDGFCGPDLTIGDPDPEPEPDPEKEYKCNGDPKTSQEVADCINQGWIQCSSDTANPDKWVSPDSSYDEVCGSKAVIEDPEPEPDSDPEYECDNGATIESGCQECPTGQDFDENGKCAPRYICDDPNATTRPDGSCGPCKAGYVFDGAVERCVQERTPNPCDNPEYAAANPTECGSSPETPPPTTEPEPEPESPGGGGGGSGMFRPQGVAGPGMGDPQLLAKLEFPVVDYLAQILPKDVQQNVMKGLFEGMV